MEEVKEEGADAAVDVEDEVGGLGEGVALHAQRVVQVARRGEEAPRVVLQQRHAHVPVVLQVHIPCWQPAPLSWMPLMRPSVRVEASESVHLTTQLSST